MKRFFSIVLTFSFVVAVVFCFIPSASAEAVELDFNTMRSYKRTRSYAFPKGFSSMVSSDFFPFSQTNINSSVFDACSFSSSLIDSNSNAYHTFSPGAHYSGQLQGTFSPFDSNYIVRFDPNLLSCDFWITQNFTYDINNPGSFWLVSTDFAPYSNFVSSFVIEPISLDLGTYHFTYSFSFDMPPLNVFDVSTANFLIYIYGNPISSPQYGFTVYNVQFENFDIYVGDDSPVDPDPDGDGTIDDIIDYQPTPALPDGSSVVSGAGDLEDDILEDQEDNLAEVSRTITNLVQPFSYFASGLSFVQHIFDYMVPTGTWQHYLLLVSLGLGVACFVLNIAHRFV